MCKFYNIFSMQPSKNIFRKKNLKNSSILGNVGVGLGKTLYRCGKSENMVHIITDARPIILCISLSCQCGEPLLKTQFLGMNVLFIYGQGSWLKSV